MTDSQRGRSMAFDNNVEAHKLLALIDAPGAHAWRCAVCGGVYMLFDQELRDRIRACVEREREGAARWDHSQSGTPAV